MENAFSRQFHDNKCLWDSLVLYYFSYEVILFQIFFEYQNPENKLSYVTNPEIRINPETFHPCIFFSRTTYEFFDTHVWTLKFYFVWLKERNCNFNFLMALLTCDFLQYFTANLRKIFNFLAFTKVFSRDILRFIPHSKNSCPEVFC